MEVVLMCVACAVQEGQFKEVLAHCLAEPGVHVIELPIDYSTSAQLQVRAISGVCTCTT